MKQVRIKKFLFNEVVKTIKGSLAVNDSRPALKKCKCEVDERFIKFTSVDGYCATIMKFEHNCENVEKFDFLFNVFNIDEDKAGVEDITIEKFDDYIEFKWLDNNLAEIKKKIKIINEEFVNVEQIYKNSRENESTTISFHANMLIRILRGFSKKTGDIVSITFANGCANKPIFIKNYNNTGIGIESLVLPVRLFEK